MDLYNSIGFCTEDLTARVAKAKLTGRAAKLLEMDGELNSITQWTKMSQVSRRFSGRFYKYGLCSGLNWKCFFFRFLLTQQRH